MSKDFVIAIIDALTSTLGDMPAKEADAIVKGVIASLDDIKDRL